MPVITSTENLVRYDAIAKIAKQFELDSIEIQQLFDLSRRTQFRYEKENPVLKPAVLDRLQRLQRIYQQAVELFEDETIAQNWLTTPKQHLNNLTPLSQLATDAGTKQVESILYRAEYGIFG
jgi:putative toxin-antitoxin system antitoxin component (TIGR02293 family)